MYRAIQGIVWGLSLHVVVQAFSQQPLGIYSRNVSSCPGYKLGSLQENETGLTARLSLMGTPCNAFGRDISDLIVQVTYESNTCLHVNIFDSANKQYTIPQDVIELPPPPDTNFKGVSDLVFNYESFPFAFWITRRSEPNAFPIFDTRLTSLPQIPIVPVTEDDSSTALDGFALVFEDQYLQLASALPLNANIYGLGEVVSSSGFRRNVETTIQTMWARDVADPVDQNLYGSHPVYLEHRFDENTNTSQSHGVFLLSAAGGDVFLFTPPSSEVSLIEYRMIGGVLDFYFFSGPTPNKVIEQYGALIGLPTWLPIWGFGFHLCRWGYGDLAETREQVTNMRQANIPLEVMWNDIDLYHAVRDFTSDPVSFPGDEMKAFIAELTANGQHYVPIVDAGIAKRVNVTDTYYPYIKGAEEHVFITNQDGTEYIGQVWPGYTVFPDWFHKNTQQWWTEALRNWSAAGIEFSGIWLDMNEASSFCDGSCGTGANISNTSIPFLLPGDPGNPTVGYPECYDSTLFGPSGNITVNGSLSCVSETSRAPDFTINERGWQEEGVDLNTPPYAIQNGFDCLSIRTLATNAPHADGQVELDIHNLWGMMEEKPTRIALQYINVGYPECYDSALFGPSGNITVNGSMSCVPETARTADFTINKRGLGAGQEKGVDLNTPPYAIHNGFGRLSINTLATNASHADGQVELDVHNLWGMMEEKATHIALQDIHPGKRPFIISRSTFPSSGRWTGHWLGDNYSLWSYLRYSISGVLQFQIFQIPFVGADTCGFNGNTDEELCNRGAIPQEPYRWDSVANASRIAISIRYSLLPYWYTLFANASTYGTPPVRALFFEFPDEPELYGVDGQFLVGGDILVTPVLTPNVSQVTGVLPGRGTVIWRDWYTHEVVENTSGKPVTFSAPLGHINVHLRDGSIILLHAKPAYTIEETRQGPYSLLISLSSQGVAFGTAYIDDGISNPPGPNRILRFSSTSKRLNISVEGDFTVKQKLTDITILGVDSKPASVLLNGQEVDNWTHAQQQSKLVALEIDVDLNAHLSLEWI